MLDLHPVVWKQINNTELTIEDLKTSDLYSFDELDKIREVEPEMFENAVDECFKVVPRNGIECQLLENGANIKVTVENRDEYVRLATQAYLHVADKQADWVREGVEIICGKNNLAHLYWMILEERACGLPNIDIGYLEKYTTYGVSEPKFFISIGWFGSTD